MFRINPDNSIKITRGDTGRIAVAITNADGTAHDAAGDTVRLTVKTSVNSPDALIQKTAVNGTLLISPADTAGLEYGSYVYDVEVTTAGGDVCTIITPTRFTIEPQVTW